MAGSNLSLHKVYTYGLRFQCTAPTNRVWRLVANEQKRRRTFVCPAFRVRTLCNAVPKNTFQHLKQGAVPRDGQRPGIWPRRRWHLPFSRLSQVLVQYLLGGEMLCTHVSRWRSSFPLFCVTTLWISCVITDAGYSGNFYHHIHDLEAGSTSPHCSSSH